MENKQLDNNAPLSSSNENNSIVAKSKLAIQNVTSKIDMRRANVIRRRVFPHLSTEVATIISVLSIVALAAGMISTATIGQEMELMTWQQPNITIEETEPTKEAEFEISVTEPITETQAIEYPTSQMCFIGDSRTVAMEGAVLTDVHFIAKSSMGLDWFNDTASVEFEKIQDEVELCVVALGINDIRNVDQYIIRLNEFADEYPNKTFIYVNLGPVDEEKYTGIPNSSLKAFNDKMQEGLSDRWQIVDQYAYLAAEGFSSHDGLHYSSQDSAKVFIWIVDSIKNQTITITKTNN